MNRFGKILLSLLVLVCVIGLIEIETDDSQVTIYSALESFRNDYIKDMLEEKFPDLNIVIQYISTNKGAAKLKLEQEYTDADIIIAFDAQSMELIKDMFADLEDYSTEHYIEGLNPEHNKYRIWEKFAGAFIINNDLLEELELPEPKTYEDLLDERYRNLIAIPDPKFSGTGYLFLKNLVNEFGEEEAFRYIDEMYPNIKQFTESGSGTIKLLLQNEVAIALGMTFQAVGEINKGANIKIIYPPEGSPYSLSGLAMIKGREKNKNVKDVFDYLYNEHIYYDKEYYSPELIFKGQKIKIDNYPTNIKYANMEGLLSSEEKQRLLKRWKY